MSTLARFRATEPAPRAPFVAPTRASLAHGRVLCFDQSLAATGWVALDHDEHGLTVVASGSLLVPATKVARGHEGSLQRAVLLHDHLATLEAQREHLVLDGRTVLHEEPPVGSRMARPESSLVAAAVIRCWANDRGLPVATVSNQHSKRILVGVPNAPKPEWHVSLSSFDISGVPARNEGERDALCLALTHLYDLQEHP